MKKRAMSQREKLLIAAALLAMGGSLYAVARYQPAQLQLARMTEETQQLKTRVNKEHIPRQTGRDAEQLQRELDKVQRNLAEEQAQLEPLESRFIGAASPAAVQELMVDISTLARSSGVIIRETQPYSAASRSGPAGRSSAAPLEAPLLTTLTANPDFQRPVKRLRLEGDYTGLRRFIEGIGSLPRRVVVLQFAFETLPMVEGQDEFQRLNANLVVAL